MTPSPAHTRPPARSRAVRTADGSTLAVEGLGPDDGPPLLLLGGAGWSRDWWDDDLCALLVDRGLRVVRHDPRDTGESSHWPAGAPGYTSADLIGDAIAVLDHLGIVAAHVVGLSMGGGIAQDLALRHRDRVHALTLIATSPVDGTPGLPDPDPALFAEPDEELDPVEALVEAERPFAPARFDEARVRAIATRVVARSRDLASAGNHMVVASGPDDGGPRDLALLAGLPTLVVHGTVDPLFPLEHGRALAAAIPGAELLEIEGMGHQLPPASSWEDLADRLAAQTRRATTPQ